MSYIYLVYLNVPKCLKFYDLVAKWWKFFYKLLCRHIQGLKFLSFLDRLFLSYFWILFLEMI